MFKSVDEINKVYNDHLESLRLSGVEFDEASVKHEHATALAEFLGVEIVEDED